MGLTAIDFKGWGGKDCATWDADNYSGGHYLYVDSSVQGGSEAVLISAEFQRYDILCNETGSRIDYLGGSDMNLGR